MDKITALVLDGELNRILDDPDSATFADLLRLDCLNSAIEDLQHILVGHHRRGLTAIKWPFKLVPWEHFSYEGKYTLPNDYYIWVEVRLDRSEDKYEIVPWENIFDDTDMALACIFAASVSAPLADSGNSGTDGFSIDGDFSGSVDTDYVVEIQTGTTFRWSNDGGSTWAASDITIDPDWQDLENDIQIVFPATSGFTAGDKWTFSGYVSKVPHILQTNGPPTSDIRVTYTRQHTKITGWLATDYLPFPIFYELIKDITVIRLRAFNEEGINVDTYLAGTATDKARDIIHFANRGERVRVRPDKPIRDWR